MRKWKPGEKEAAEQQLKDIEKRYRAAGIGIQPQDAAPPSSAPNQGSKDGLIAPPEVQGPPMPATGAPQGGQTSAPPPRPPALNPEDVKAQAQAAIEGGAAKDSVLKRLMDNGFDPAALGF